MNEDKQFVRYETFDLLHGTSWLTICKNFIHVDYWVGNNNQWTQAGENLALLMEEVLNE